MGLNVDLAHMLNLGDTVECPKCGNRTSNRWGDYDIERGNPNPTPGYWELRVCCDACEHEFTVELSVTTIRTDGTSRRRIYDFPPVAPCPSCGGIKKELVNGKLIYPHRPDLAHKMFWRCADCDKSYVGCHPDTTVPLGTLADEETRRARCTAHNAFDQLWRSGLMKRREAYAWLAKALELPPEECHISWFGAETCERVTKLAQDRFSLGRR